MLRQLMHKRRSLIALVVLFTVIGMALYAQVILRGPFLFDDMEYVVDNPIITDLRAVLGMSDPRQFGYLTFALNYALGGEDPTGYHLFNVLVHIANSLLVFALVRSLFFVLGRFQEPSPAHRQTALLAALVFLVHPVQTQAVSYVTQRFTSLATLFYLLAVWLYLVARARFEQSGMSRGGYALYAMSLLSTVLAMRTKEISATIPVVVLLLEAFVLAGSRFRRRRFLFLLPFAAAAFIIPLAILGPEWGITGRGEGVAEVTRMEKLFDLKSRPALPYLFTQFRVIIVYIRILLLPVGLRIVYDFPVSYTFFNVKVMASLFFLVLFFAGGVYLWKKGASLNERTDASLAYRMAAIGIFWFFITLAVESSFLPIKDIIFEHRVYLPSVGFILAGAVLIMQLSGRLFKTGGQLLAVGVPIALVALPLSVGTLVRNGVWADEVKLWDDVVQKSPGKAIGYNNRGMAYAKRGDFELALNDLDRAIDFFPKNRAEMAKWENADMAPSNMAKTYLGRGDVLIALGRTEMAREDYRMGRKMASMPVNVDDRLVLADRYAKRGAYKHALEEYNKILEWEPEHIEALNDRANAYSYLGRYQEAIRDLTRIIALDPDFVLAYHNRGIALAWVGKTDRAVTDFEHACTAGFPPACESAEIVRRGGK